MAEAVAVAAMFVSPIIKVVLDNAQCYLKSRYKWIKEVPFQLEQLAGLLTVIHLNIFFVEKRRLMIPHSSEVLEWLSQLKEAVYDAEDVLDEFAYLVLVNIQEKHGVKQALSTSIWLSKQLIGTDESLIKLKDAVRKIDGIVNGCKTGTIIQILGSPMSQWSLQLDNVSSRGSLTGRIPVEEIFLGREKELNEIVRRLVHNFSQSGVHGVPVVAIVGDGGMGKTALVQHVLSDERVNNHFTKKIWACATDRYSEIELTKEILQGLQVEITDSLRSFDLLQNRLREELKDHKILLVLDDVWNNEDKNETDNRSLWWKVLAPLRFGNKEESRIVVTTRLKMVADTMQARNPIILGGLAHEPQWALFRKCAFSDDDPDKYPELLVIGRQIAKMLKGSPLATRVVGESLVKSRRKSKWEEYILNENIYENHYMKPLEMSYHKLPEHLQRCFSFCSLFPRKWKLEPDKLVKFWIAVGFVETKTNKRLEDLGREYFDQLFRRSFFRAYRQGHKTYYYIHDLMHRMARSVSFSDFGAIEGAKPNKFSDKIRHLSITADRLPDLKNLCNVQKLRTLLVIKCESSSGRIEDDVFDEMKMLRVLDLSGCKSNLLRRKVDHLIHLRYLALNTATSGLPESISKLLHLQTLIIPKRCHLQELPKNISYLTNLRHLDVDVKLTSTIRNIGKLADLQGSVEFHAGKDGCTLKELMNLKHLRRELNIKNLDMVKDKHEASLAKLCQKDFLKVLKLEWNFSGISLSSSAASDVLEGLQPHSNLQELYIKRYHGSKIPSWLPGDLQERQLCYLKLLHLINCRKWEVLPPLGQLPCLKDLLIKEMNSVKTIGPEFYGKFEIAFPMLMKLTFDDMPNLREWSSATNSNVFPCLQKVKLLHCPQMMKLPCFPSSVKKLTILQSGCCSHLTLAPIGSPRLNKFSLDISGMVDFPEGLLPNEVLLAVEVLSIRCSKEPCCLSDIPLPVSLRKLRISECDISDKQLIQLLYNLHSLTSLEVVRCKEMCSVSLQEGCELLELCIRDCPLFSSVECLQQSCTLESLIIETCPKLTSSSFPASFNQFGSLNTLKISDCSDLDSLPECGLPSSLQFLYLNECHPTLTEKLHGKSGCEWEKISSIPRIVLCRSND